MMVHPLGEDTMRTMTAQEQQDAFDLLASLVERQKNTGEFDEHTVWDAAEAFCNNLRAAGYVRDRYLKDFLSLD